MAGVRQTVRTGASPAAAAAPRLQSDLLAGEDLPPAPRQQRSLAKRARLKAAAVRLFGEHGYEHTSIDDIARSADLATGGFYLHFRSKRQLLLVLMGDLVGELSRLDLELGGSRDVRTALRALLARAFAVDVKYLGAVRAWQEAVWSDPGLARKHRAIHAWTHARVAALFAHLQRHPDARRDADVAGLARAVDVMLWAFLAEAMLVSRPELDRWLDSATHLIYHALFRDRDNTAVRKKGGGR
jgi:AcrR family transcriptional regulator